MKTVKDYELNPEKSYQKHINKIMWITVIYMFVFQGVTGLAMWGLRSLHLGQGSLDGLPYFISCFLGGLVIYSSSTPLQWKSYFKTGKQKMNIESFAKFALFTLAIQFFTGFYTMILNYVMQLFGISILGQVKSASAGDKTFTLMIYAIVIAPLLEELVFRGYVFRNLEKYNLKLAAVVSAFLFGIYHMNVVQIPFAFLMGLLLAYIAYNYGFKWAVLFHMFNNGVIGELVQLLNNNWIQFSLVVLQIFACFYVIRYFVVNYDKIKAWLHANRIPKGYLKKAFLNLPCIFIIVVSLVLTYMTLN